MTLRIALLILFYCINLSCIEQSKVPSLEFLAAHVYCKKYHAIPQPEEVPEHIRNIIKAYQAFTKKTVAEQVNIIEELITTNKGNATKQKEYERRKQEIISYLKDLFFRKISIKDNFIKRFFNDWDYPLSSDEFNSWQDRVEKETNLKSKELGIKHVFRNYYDEREKRVQHKRLFLLSLIVTGVIYWQFL